MGISTRLLVLQPKGWGFGSVLPLRCLAKLRCILLRRVLYPPLSLHIGPSPQGCSTPPLPSRSACRAKSAWPRYFTSHQHKPSPALCRRWLGWARRGQSQPRSQVVGETPEVPLPLSGVAIPPLWPYIWLLWAGGEAGAHDQLERQQQQPLLFHTSVFLAPLRISVQELKLRSLAEVLSVVTALRAVVRHSLACSLPLSFFLFPFFFFKVCSSDLLFPCGYTVQLSRQGTRGGK